jgi:hypothetical protein
LRHLGVWHAVCGLHPLLHRYYGALHRLLTSLFPDYHHLARGYCPLSLGFCLFSRTVASCPENHGALNFGRYVHNGVAMNAQKLYTPARFEPGSSVPGLLFSYGDQWHRSLTGNGTMRKYVLWTLVSVSQPNHYIEHQTLTLLCLSCPWALITTIITLGNCNATSFLCNFVNQHNE